MRWRKIVYTIIFFMLMFASSDTTASAVSLDLQLNTTEFINGLVFYTDGTYGLDNATGSMVLANPSLNHTVSDINVDFSPFITPSAIHINTLPAGDNILLVYQIDPSAVNIPVSVVETFSPKTLIPDVNQTVVFNVTISNSGSKAITIVQFDKSFPPELTLKAVNSTVGSADCINNSFKWNNIIVLPGDSESAQLTFYTSSDADISVLPSNLSFSMPNFVASTAISLSAVTTTSFSVEKEPISGGRWGVGVKVSDESEFNYSLYNVKVYVSDTVLNDTLLIKDYDLDVVLEPGQSWSDAFQYDYSGVPVFFAQVFYTIPFNLSGSSVPLTPVESGGYIIKAVVIPPPNKGGGSGGGGGGGGGNSGEDFKNIECSNVDRQFVNFDENVTYTFSLDCSVVKNIQFEGKTGAGKISAKIETLSNRSSMADSDPPNIVYKYFNAWVGNLGWFSEKNVANPVITFSMEKSWLDENNLKPDTVALYHFNNGTWNKLSTWINNESSEFYYFTADLPIGLLGPMAITAGHNESIISSPAVESIRPTPVIEATPAEIAEFIVPAGVLLLNQKYLWALIFISLYGFILYLSRYRFVSHVIFAGSAGEELIQGIKQFLVHRIIHFKAAEPLTDGTEAQAGGSSEIIVKLDGDNGNNGASVRFSERMLDTNDIFSSVRQIVSVIKAEQKKHRNILLNLTGAADDHSLAGYMAAVITGAQVYTTHKGPDGKIRNIEDVIGAPFFPREQTARRWFMIMNELSNDQYISMDELMEKINPELINKSLDYISEIIKLHGMMADQRMNDFIESVDMERGFSIKLGRFGSKLWGK